MELKPGSIHRSQGNPPRAWKTPYEVLFMEPLKLRRRIGVESLEVTLRFGFKFGPTEILKILPYSASGYCLFSPKLPSP